jgi:hypothetical protein
MIDWHHPRIYERLRCFGLTLFTLGVASHNEVNQPVAIAAIIVATLLVVRLRIELRISRDEERASLERKLKRIDLINALAIVPAALGALELLPRLPYLGMFLDLGNGALGNHNELVNEENMHFTLSAIAGMLAQEWYVICAYFGTYVLLEVREHGERIAAHRVVRHALWAASFVIVLHAVVVTEVLTRRTGFHCLRLGGLKPVRRDKPVGSRGGRSLTSKD